MNRIDIIKRAARLSLEDKLPADRIDTPVLPKQILAEEAPKERVTFKDGGKLLIKE